MSMMRQLRNCVLVDGARLPFQPSGPAYNKLVAYDLARLALTGILTKTGVKPTAVDYVLMGTVIQEARACAARPERPPFFAPTLPAIRRARAPALRLTVPPPSPCAARRQRTRTLLAMRGSRPASRRACRRTR